VVGIAASADEAVTFAESERPALVLMDVRLIGPRGGVYDAEEIRRRFGIGIFVTANSDPRTLNGRRPPNRLGFLRSR
jgi:CheY-like chemotaxis protein